MHGSGFGTFSLASASPINTSKNGGSSAAVIAGKPPASTPSSASMNRNSRSPASLSRGGGGGAGGSGGTGTALTRADLVREHSRQRQRQMNDQRSSGHVSVVRHCSPRSCVCCPPKKSLFSQWPSLPLSALAVKAFAVPILFVL